MFIGAENIISPLGDTAKITFERMFLGDISIQKQNNISVSTFNCSNNDLFSLMQKSIEDSMTFINYNKLVSSNTLLIVSTTKGQINLINSSSRKVYLNKLKNSLKNKFPFIKKSIIISTACVSGLQSIIVANDFIRNKYYDNVIVCGGDLVSQFVVEGFKSFFALSDKPCMPFDKNRNGISLGEAVSTIIISNDLNLYQQQPFKILGGCSTNDANHISAPHIDAIGLIQSITRTLQISKIKVEDIDFINTHGTATVYNDMMELKALNQLKLYNTPFNSFKGYFGHTLGAAGIIETALTLQTMRNNMLLKSMGFEKNDFDKELSIITKNKKLIINTALKLSSGFGGFNGALIIQDI